MLKLYLLLFVWGPALVGFAAGWLVVHPSDWTGPAVVGPVGLALTAFSFRLGIRRVRTLSGDDRALFIGGMAGAALVGVIVFAMLCFGAIG